MPRRYLWGFLGCVCITGAELQGWGGAEEMGGECPYKGLYVSPPPFDENVYTHDPGIIKPGTGMGI